MTKRSSGVHVALALLLLFAAAGSRAASGEVATSVPPPFEPLRTREESAAVIVELWGRSYRFTAGPLPSEIRSQGVSLLGARPRFRLAEAQGEQEITWQPPTVVEATPAVVRLLSTGRTASLEILAQTRVEYDGMILVELSLNAEKATKVARLHYEITLDRGVARFFAHHLPYDYRADNVDKRRLLEAAGMLPDRLALEFTPSLALGDRQVGIEWWSETNAHWVPPPDGRPIAVVRSADAASLRVTPIAAPLALDSGAFWHDAFALFVFPARPPPERWRSVRFLPYQRAAAFAAEVGTRFVFLATQSTFHARHDGLPASLDDTFQRELRSELRRRGVEYMPYGMLTLAPILHPRTMSHLEAWSADGKWWRIQPGQPNPVIRRNHPELGDGAPYSYPVCAARQDYFDWILAENLATLRAGDLDALYFDHGAITRMCLRNPLLRGRKDRESWEYLNVRAFYKRLYERVNAERPKTLVVIHTHGTPKALGAFVDFHMFGETLSTVFGGGRPSSFYRGNPERYVPDYLALPDGYLDAQLFPPVGGAASVIPQIKWAIDPAHPERARRHQRTFHAIMLSNDTHAPLWVSDLDAADEIYRAIDRFGDFGTAAVHPWWSNASAIERAEGLRATAWIRDGKALLVLANLGESPVRGRIELDLQALSLPGARRHRNLERAGWWSASLETNGFEVDVPARDLRIELIE